jgi:hypothetical protein
MVGPPKGSSSPYLVPYRCHALAANHMSQTKHDTDFCFSGFVSEHKFQDTKEYDPDEQKDRA